MDKNEHGSDTAKHDDAPKTWGDRLKSSFLIGLSITAVWAVAGIAMGQADPTTAEGFGILLGNGVPLIFLTSGIAFVIKAVRHFIKGRTRGR